MELRDYIIEELVKLQERSSRNVLGMSGGSEHVNEWVAESNQIEAAREALEKLGFTMLDEQLHWPAHNEWTKRIEDGPVLLDGEEAPEPIDLSIMEFSDEEKDFYRKYVDDNTVVVDLTDEGDGTPVDTRDYLGELMVELSR